MLNFIRNLLGVKADKATQAAIEALVRWDPQGATEAELRTMEDHLDDLGIQVAEARASYNREKQEADAVKLLLNQRMAAAEMLQNQATGAADPTKKVDLEKSLATLVDMLEQMTPDVERESQDATDALDFLTTLEATYNEAGAKLKAARSELGQAQREMKRAEQTREQAERQAEAARQAAGLSNTTNSLNVALKAMKESAAHDLAAAESANAKAKLLKPSQPEKEDPNIASALAAASGTQQLPQAPGDRLAAIKSRLGR